MGNLEMDDCFGPKQLRIQERVWGFIIDRSDIGGAPQLALQLCLIGGPTTSLAFVVAAMRRVARVKRCASFYNT